MVAMFTAVSYERMARAYPSAGSVFTYVGCEIHPTLGFLAGWGYMLSLLVGTLIGTIWCSKAADNIWPAIPYAGWVVFFTALFTLLNLRGIRASARTNEGLVVVMSVVIFWFFVAAIRYVIQHGAVWSQPFSHPSPSMSALSKGTSLAVLTFIGFDGIATLSEEAENPRRNAARHRIHLSADRHPGDRASVPGPARLARFSYLSRRGHCLRPCGGGAAGGPALFACDQPHDSGSQHRLRHGRATGRSPSVIWDGARRRDPESLLRSDPSPAPHSPEQRAVHGAFSLAGAFLMNYQLGAELLNFGALFGFMGVNAAAFVHYFLRQEKSLANLLPPVLGFVVCFLFCGSM